MKRLRVTASAIGAALLMILAVVTVRWYRWDVVVRQAGRPDRSMLFWGLPVLFVGVAAAGTGGALAYLAVRLHRAG